MDVVRRCTTNATDVELDSKDQLRSRSARQAKADASVPPQWRAACVLNQATMYRRSAMHC